MTEKGDTSTPLPSIFHGRHWEGCMFYMSKRECGFCKKEMSNEYFHFNSQYCSENCKTEAVNKLNRESWQKRKALNLNYKEDYREYFFSVVTESFHLTKNGFKEVSVISPVSIMRAYKTTWLDLIYQLNKFNELYEYIKQEYINFYNNTESASFNKFTKQHKYINMALCRDIGVNKIASDCKVFKSKNKYIVEDVVHDFEEIKKAVGNIPTYTEFMKYKKISKATYDNLLIKESKTKSFDLIIHTLCTEKEYELYLYRQYQGRNSAGKMTGGLSCTYTLEDYEKEFKRVFEYCLEQYGDYPSRKLFNKLSNHDDSVYRSRLQMSWLNVCAYFGYQIDESHKSEKMLMNIIKNLTNEDYIPQKQFSWLKSNKNQYLRCDAYFPNLQLIVEFDGIQHRIPKKDFGGEDSFKRVKENDALKNKKIPENGLKLIRIDSRCKWYDYNFIANVLKENGIEINQIEEFGAL